MLRRPKWQMMVTALHETIPGRHLQVSLFSEMTTFDVHITGAFNAQHVYHGHLQRNLRLLYLLD